MPQFHNFYTILDCKYILAAVGLQYHSENIMLGTSFKTRPKVEWTLWPTGLHYSLGVRNKQ